MLSPPLIEAVSPVPASLLVDISLAANHAYADVVSSRNNPELGTWNIYRRGFCGPVSRSMASVISEAGYEVTVEEACIPVKPVDEVDEWVHIYCRLGQVAGEDILIDGTWQQFLKSQQPALPKVLIGSRPAFIDYVLAQGLIKDSYANFWQPEPVRDRILGTIATHMLRDYLTTA